MWIRIKNVNGENIRYGYNTYLDCLNDKDAFLVRRDGIFYVKI